MARNSPQWQSSLFAAFTACVPIVVFLAPLVSAILYVGPVFPIGKNDTPSPAWPVLAGSGLALAIWLIGAWLTWISGRASIHGANAAVYRQLVERYRELERRLAILPALTVRVTPTVVQPPQGAATSSYTVEVGNDSWAEVKDARLQITVNGATKYERQPASDPCWTPGANLGEFTADLAPRSTTCLQVDVDAPPPAKVEILASLASPFGLQGTITAAYAGQAVPLTSIVAAGLTAALRQDVEALGCDLDQDKARPELRWVSGIGYVDLWRRIHRIEEDLIRVEPTATVIQGASYDEQRLTGSQVDNREALLARLCAAASALDPLAASACLAKPSAVAPQPVNGTQAREILREVRNQVNDYRDSLRAGLVRQRASIAGKFLAGGFVTYAIIAFAIIAHGFRPAILAATAFWLAGMFSGLFGRWNSEARTDKVVEDFGVARARLSSALLFSGAAAVGGVLVTELLAQDKTPNLSNIFDLQAGPNYLLVALVFGLTPSLLVARLSQQTEQYKADLKGSEPSNRSKP